MLTRFQVSGFKNLVDVDIRFGPFTCIAGANGVGKSNLFDAIRFLSALAEDQTLVEAANSVREGRTADVRGLFHRSGDSHGERMSFKAEMIVPEEGADDLGQPAKASITFLRYTLELIHRKDAGQSSLGGLEVEREELVHINLGDASKHLLFPHKPIWKSSAIKGKRSPPLISTVEGAERVIKVHHDGHGGRTASRRAASLPRTVLSAANAAESPTALLARNEMRSWRLLQLEPSALRKPDEFTAQTRLGSDGSHLAATLYRLAREGEGSSGEGEPDEARTYAQVANRLAHLIEDVREVGIDRDERRELLTLIVKGRDGTSHPARALSDGTLRFLALAVIELDPEAQGVLCLEEPENGIHPERIPAMLNLLKDIATDPEEPVGSDNPLRQVIVNTHSPAVVSEVPDDSLIVAESNETSWEGRRTLGVGFSCLEGTWRQKAAGEDEHVTVISRGKLLAYLNPSHISVPVDGGNGRGASHRPTSSVRPRVADRPDLQNLLPFPPEPR
ncbi:MAG: AAA family ATPase [Singulisphaera sp.]